MANSNKKNIVTVAQKVIQENTNFAVIQISNSKHKDLEALRKELLNKNSKIKVIKNTLFEKAVNKLSQSSAVYKKIRTSFFPLRSRSAILTFSSDWADGLKTFYNKIKDSETFAFKFGVIDNNTYDEKSMVALSKLPSKTELVGQFIGIIKNPVSKTVSSLKNPMQSLVFILSQKSKQE